MVVNANRASMYFYMNQHGTREIIYFPAMAQDSNSCFVDGECTRGLLLREYDLADPQTCLRACRDWDAGAECNYFTFYESDEEGEDGSCLLLANCESIDHAGCDNCFTGQGSCQGEQFNKNIIFNIILHEKRLVNI
jgi:hypothetical protein